MSLRETISSPQEDQPPLGRALDLMKTALLLLDGAEASPDIGAHLDLAICRLSETLDLPWPDSSAETQQTD